MRKARKKKQTVSRLIVLAILLISLLFVFFITSGQVKVITVKSNASVESQTNTYTKLELTSDITTLTDLKKISKTPKNIVFFTSSWCGMCNATKITLENELRKYDDSKHVTLMDAQIENNRGIANEYEITNAPSLLINEDDGVTIINNVNIQEIPQIVSNLFE